MATLTVGDTTPRVQYTATSGQTVFAYGFPIFADADLKVYVDSTLKTLTTDYTVSGAATTSGGNVTFGSGLTAGDIVTIYRDLAVARASDYQTGGDLLAETLNDDLDKLVMMVQQSESDVANRSIRFGQFVTGLPLSEITDNATARANKVIGFDSSGQPGATTEIGNFQGDWAASTAYVTRDIIKDTSNNNIYINNESHTSSGSQPISSNTDSGKWDLLVDAASATTSATNAASSATAAASSATAAASSATSAASSATTATTQASTATTQASNAATSATNAATSATSSDNAASAVGAKFTFDSSTTMADPGAGDFRFNHATIASVTAVAFDATSADTGNPDLSDFIATWDDSTSTINGHLIFKKSGTPATFAIFTVGAVTDNTGWLQVALTHVDSNGSWSASDDAYVQFVRTGDKGDTGATGSTGATGPRGSDAGLDMTFESATADSDQGAGKVWFNHATLSSATVLYMDDVDANAANINTLVDSWDDSTTTALRGTIKVTQKADNAIFAIYNVTGAVTSASTYSKIPVTYITGAGSFTDADASTVWFSRTGDTGAAGSSTPADNTFRIQDNADATKQIAFEASGITTGNTRTITMPDSDITLVSSGAIVNTDINASAAIATSKISGLATSATTDTTNASNISSGTLPIARITDHLDHTNIVINGSFDVWQRGISIASSGYYQMYADRWMGDAFNNTGFTINRNSAGTSEPFRRFLKFKRDASSTSTAQRRIGTVFESNDCWYLAGQEVTLSWYMKKGADYSPSSDTITSYILTGTGTNESMQNGLGSAWTGFAQQTQSNTVTTSWTRFTHTVTLSASAKQVGFYFNCPAATGTAGSDDSFSISGVKLELGSVATPLVNEGFGIEMTRCQRYYSKSYDADTTPGSSGAGGSLSGLAIYSSGSQGLGARWPVAMRTSPTVVLYSTDGTSGKVIQTSNNANISASAGSTGANGFEYVSGSLPNTAANGYRFHFTADAEL